MTRTAGPPPRHHAPTDEERRQAACMAMANATSLLRFASRYVYCLQDAEDAYMRAMEIALTQAPTVEPRAYTSWLHVVIRHEAAAILKARRREGPAAEEDVAASDDLREHAWEESRPDAVAEWRERYAGLQDALLSLTAPQRICVMLRSVGCGRAQISHLTGFTPRKVERSLVEGRAALAKWQLKLAAGEQCERMAPLIARVAEQEATEGERRLLSRHVSHCMSCKAALRIRRASAEGLASLVPPALLVGGFIPTAADPSVALGYWERLVGSVTVRTGNIWQGVAELPAIWGSKVGAGTVAVVLAGAAGGPFVYQAVNQPDGPVNQRPGLALAVPQAAAPPPAVVVTPPPAARPAARPAPARPAPRVRRRVEPPIPRISTEHLIALVEDVRRDNAARARAAAAATAPAPSVSVTVTPPPPAPASRPASPPPAPPRPDRGLEFGP